MRPAKQLRTLGSLFKETFLRWMERDPFRDSAVIAYYTIFSLPGLLVVVINLAGYFFGDEMVTDNISDHVHSMIGPEAASYVEAVVVTASEHDAITISSVIGILTMLFGATGVFYQLQQTLNLLWEVKPQPKRMWIKLIMDRVFSFGLILVVGFLLLVSLVLSALLTILSDWVSYHLTDYFNILFRAIDISVSLAAVTLLFAAIFKFLPDAKVQWRDVWIGALVTAILFVFAKYLLGLYFGHSDPASPYGAAGSVVLIMLWVTYSGMILLFGATFTRVWADRYGTHILPAEYAISTRHEDQHPEQDKTSGTD